MNRPRSSALAAPLLLLTLASLGRSEEGAAPPVSPGEPIRSMGQPAIWKKYGGASYSLGSGAQSRGAAAYLGLYKDLLPSVAGIGLSGGPTPPARATDPPSVCARWPTCGA